MTFFPDRTTFLSFGNLSIKWYAVLIITGAFVAYLVSLKDIISRKSIKVDDFSDLFVYTLFAGVIGSRIWFCLFYDFSFYLSNPINIIRIWDGGLAIQGGLAGGFIYVYSFCKKNNISLLVLADCMLPNVLIGQAFGRWGNFINKECHGVEVSEAYFDGILSFLKDGMYIGGKYYEPLFFYESMLCIMGWALIHFVLKKNQNKRGDLTWCYLIWYGIVRFFIERTRTDSLYIGNIKMAMLTSVVFIVVGVLGYVDVLDKLFKKKKPTIIFDMDGTLIDTAPSIISAYEALFEKYDDIKNFTKERRAEVLGPALRDIFPKYFPGHDYDELYAVYRARQIEVSPKVNKPMNNVLTTLKSLHEDNYKIAILSTRSHDGIEELLKDHQLETYVDYICGLKDVDNLKPDPEGIFKIVKEKGFNASDVIMIGDSPMDIKCGQNYGAYTVGYINNLDKKDDMYKASANEYIEDISEVLNIVSKKQYFTYNLK